MRSHRFTSLGPDRGGAGRACRPGGMERPGDDYGETHKVVLRERDVLFGGQVSRLQVSQLVGAAVANTELAENKARTPFRQCLCTSIEGLKKKLQLGRDWDVRGQGRGVGERGSLAPCTAPELRLAAGHSLPKAGSHV